MKTGTRRTVLVTGGAKRIGAAICRRFAADGWRVVVHYNSSREDGIALVEELGGIGIQVDFRDMEAVSGIMPELVRLDAVPELLVNSASVYRRGTLADMEPALVREMFAVNFDAPFELMRSFRLHCCKGAIINITDQRTAYADPWAGAYALAKKALAAATESAALEWAPDIRVNAVAPGLVMSPPGVDPSAIEPLVPRIPMQERTDVEEVADACAYLAGASAVTGQTMYLDGGLHLLGYSVESPVPSSKGCKLKSED